MMSDRNKDLSIIDIYNTYFRALNGQNAFVKEIDANLIRSQNQIAAILDESALIHDAPFHKVDLDLNLISDGVKLALEQKGNDRLVIRMLIQLYNTG